MKQVNGTKVLQMASALRSTTRDFEENIAKYAFLCETADTPEKNRKCKELGADFRTALQNVTLDVVRQAVAIKKELD